MTNVVRVSTGITMLAVLLAVPALSGAAPEAAPAGGAAAAYPPGPCCPTAQAPGGTATGPYWGSNAVSFTGPKFVCGPAKPLSVTYGGRTVSTNYVVAAGTMLIPVRAFGVVGASVALRGTREVNVTLGDRSVLLVLGSPKVTIAQADEATEAEWELCPRLRNGATYVPARAMAAALGFSVRWVPGSLTLTAVDESVTAPAEDVACPVTKLEDSLGIEAVRGQVETPFGTGVGVVKVIEGSNAEKLGLQPKDVIIACAGQRVSCPKDLEAIMAAAKEEGVSPCAFTIVRGGEKVELTCAPGE